MDHAAKSTGNLADFAKKTASTFREFEELSPFKAESLMGFKTVLTDLAKLQKERGVTLGTDSRLIGVGTVNTGSLSEFGRLTGGKTGLFSSTKVQTAKAKVDIRLIDVRTGHAVYWFLIFLL